VEPSIEVFIAWLVPPLIKASDQFLYVIGYQKMPKIVRLLKYLLKRAVASVVFHFASYTTSYPSRFSPSRSARLFFSLL